MKSILQVTLACVLACVCKCQLYPGFQSPFVSKLYPPSTVQWKPQSQKLQAAYQQPSSVPCQHPTFPAFNFPFTMKQPQNLCPSFEAVLPAEVPSQRETSPSLSVEAAVTTTKPIETTSKLSRIEQMTTTNTTSVDEPDFSQNFFSKQPSIVALKCEEYTGMSVERDFGTSLSLTATVTNLTMKTCDISLGLIVGGVKSNPGDFPHMAAIGFRNVKGANVSFECGGSLISDRFVLTAAHCQFRNGVPAAKVRLGALNLSFSSKQDYEIEEFIAHEKHDSSTKQNDIAVIKLQKIVHFDDPIKVRPACLWQSGKLDVNQAIAAGYGATKSGGEMNSDLMKVRLDILDNDACIKYFIDTSVDEDYVEDNVVINDNQLCIGSYVAKKDTCNGDSGGPVQIKFDENPCVSHIIGITSFGSTVCGGENTPAVYTKISAYIDWIESKILLVCHSACLLELFPKGFIPVVYDFLEQFTLLEFVNHFSCWLDTAVFFW